VGIASLKVRAANFERRQGDREAELKSCGMPLGDLPLDLVPLKLFLLVYGLDEYDGDQAEIVSLFSEISSKSNV
jgi:hypothetical protein